MSLFLDPYRFGQTDPYFANVISLLHFNDAAGTTIPVDVIPGVTWSNSVPARAKVSSTQKKFGAGSLARPFDPSGMTVGGLYGLFPNITWTASTNYTVEYWIYFTSFTSWSVFGTRHITIAKTPSSDGVIMLAVSGSGKIIGDGSITGTGTTTVSLNTWYHVAITSDGSTGRVFLNGNLEFTFTPFIVSASPNSVAVSPGRSFTINGDSYEGYLDDFRLTFGICRYISNFIPPISPFPDV